MVGVKLLRRALSGLVLAAVSLPCPASAEYLLAPGDVVKLSAAGVAEFRQRSRIDVNGEISLPLIGQLKAAGRPLSELRDEVRQLLPTKSLRRKTVQGLDVIVIDPEEITLEIAEYRPIYVNGDVSRPGELGYRLGMTVRQAVAQAGGYDLLRFRADTNPIMQSADLRTEHQNLWREYAQAQAQIWRVDAEFGKKSDLPTSAGDELRQMPLSPTVANQILRAFPT